MLKILLEYLGTILIFFFNHTTKSVSFTTYTQKTATYIQQSYPFDAYSMRHFCLLQLFQGHWNGDNGS